MTDCACHTAVMSQRHNKSALACMQKDLVMQAMTHLSVPEYTISNNYLGMGPQTTQKRVVGPTNRPKPGRKPRRTAGLSAYGALGEAAPQLPPLAEDAEAEAGGEGTF